MEGDMWMHFFNVWNTISLDKIITEMCNLIYAWLWPIKSRTNVSDDQLNFGFSTNAYCGTSPEQDFITSDTASDSDGKSSPRFFQEMDFEE